MSLQLLKIQILQTMTFLTVQLCIWKKNMKMRNMKRSMKKTLAFLQTRTMVQPQQDLGYQKQATGAMLDCHLIILSHPMAFRFMERVMKVMTSMKKIMKARNMKARNTMSMRMKEYFQPLNQMCLIWKVL